jgi:lysine 2,3-aminomutase
MQEWVKQLRNRIRNPSEIEKIFKNLTEDEKKGLKETVKVFPIAITPYYLSLADKEDINCPIRNQIIPKYSEIDPKIQQNLWANALNEEDQIPHMTHRYKDRVLITITTMCPVYCRHCMRKRKVGKPEKALNEKEFKRIYDYIKKHKEIREILISGGDPLVLSTEKLFSYISLLKKIEHIEVIRIGTRTPVVLPHRFYEESLLRYLERYSPIWIITHFNHPKEITPEVKKATQLIQKTGSPILNQTVLLKGINDNASILKELFRKLVSLGIKPYYLFHCDPIYGTAHFRTSLKKGIYLYNLLKRDISGLALPFYALDLPHGKGKVIISENNILQLEDNRALLRTPWGEVVEYFT